MFEGFKCLYSKRMTTFIVKRKGIPMKKWLILQRKIIKNVVLQRMIEKKVQHCNRKQSISDQNN